MIYVVMGQSGCYSDHRSWAVCAYQSLALATKHADQATEYVVKRVGKRTGYREPEWTQYYNACRALEKAGSPFDPYLAEHGVDDDTDYYVLNVPELEALPTEDSPFIPNLKRNC